jgi:hypothetical protein
MKTFFVLIFFVRHTTSASIRQNYAFTGKLLLEISLDSPYLRYNLSNLASQSIMENPWPPQKLIDDINFFRKYRDPTLPDWNSQDVKDNYRVNLFPDHPEPEAVIHQFPGWPPPGQAMPPSASPERDSQKSFLDNPMPGLITSAEDQVNWRGTRYLGGGGGGKVGLWEYTGPEDAAPETRKLVVKQTVADWPSTDLQEEGEMIEVIRKRAKSSHIITLITPPEGIVAQDEGLGAEWDGVVRRIKLEYCELGDIKRLIRTRSVA